MKPTGKVRKCHKLLVPICATQFHEIYLKRSASYNFTTFFPKFKDLATVFDERTTVLALSTLFHQKAEQYKENVPKVRISCFNFSLNPLRFFIARENDRNLSTVKSWVICKSSILTNYKVPNDYKLFIIAQLLPLLIFVSVSLVRKNLK